MQEVAHFEITLALKQAFKARGVTYKDVAERIGVSEQTIKRLFREKDCSLSRLNELCDAINISVYDLLDISRQHSESATKLTDQQEEFLRDNPSHFSFLFFLTAQYSLETIKSRYELSEVTTFRYLRDLDKQGFIELSANNQFRLLIEGRILMQLDGPLGEVVRQRNHFFLEYVCDHDGETGSTFSSSFRLMSTDTLNALHTDFAKLDKKYRKASYQDASLLPKEKLHPVKWVSMVAPFEICGLWPLDKNIE